jgi:hypothetical protein
MANVDLAGHGSGDEGGAAFLQELDCALGLGGEGVELGGLDANKCNDVGLLVERRNGNDEIADLLWANVRNTNTRSVRGEMCDKHLR